MNNEIKNHNINQHIQNNIIKMNNKIKDTLVYAWRTTGVRHRSVPLRVRSTVNVTQRPSPSSASSRIGSSLLLSLGLSFGLSFGLSLGYMAVSILQELTYEKYENQKI